MADFASYESLSREERLRRIGALFCKAVTLASTRRQNLMRTESDASLMPVKPTAAEGVIGTNSLREDECALLKRFAHLGGFSPREATQFWGIARTSAYRRLQRLEKAGWIVRNGETNAARYHLTAQTFAILKQVVQTVQAQKRKELSIDHTTPAPK